MSPISWNDLIAQPDIQGLIELALKEDIGDGDVTTRWCFPQPKIVRAQIIAREETVVCGLPLAQLLFSRLDPSIEFLQVAQEGDLVSSGQSLLELRGDVRSLLTAERCALNFLMRLCGIASGARKATNVIPSDCKAQIFDTRKTTPGWRRLEKAAVYTGGAQNHRFGLFDAVLIKDNHIAAAGSIKEAIELCRAQAPEGMTIQVEIDTLEQLNPALQANPDIILLDNFSIQKLAEAVHLTKGQCLLEASGGVTLQTIEAIARTGVDRISMGAITHSIIPADLGLDMAGSPR